MYALQLSKQEQSNSTTIVHIKCAMCYALGCHMTRTEKSDLVGYHVTRVQVNLASVCV